MAGQSQTGLADHAGGIPLVSAQASVCDQPPIRVTALASIPISYRGLPSKRPIALGRRYHVHTITDLRCLRSHPARQFLSHVRWLEALPLDRCLARGRYPQSSNDLAARLA